MNFSRPVDIHLDKINEHNTYRQRYDTKKKTKLKRIIESSDESVVYTRGPADWYNI